MHANNKTILVTGGAGFIGSKISKQLFEEGNQVIVADNLSTGKKENIPDGCNFLEMDLGNPSSIEKLKPFKFDAILHLAGQSSGEASFLDPVYDFNSHVTSTFHLLKFALDNKVPRFIYASSMGAYGDPEYLPVDEKHPRNPKSYYGASKSSAENYVNLFYKLGVNTTAFRMFNVYGPGQNLENMRQGMVSIYLAFMLEGKTITVKGDKNRFRDFIFIDDVVDVWVNSIDQKNTFGKTYNLATGKKTTVEELLLALYKAFGEENYPTEFKGSTTGDQFGLVADITLLKHDLSWKPKIQLDEGIKKTVEFEKSRRN